MTSGPDDRQARRDTVGRDPTPVLAFLRELIGIDSTPGQEAAIVRRVVEEMRSRRYDDAFIDDAGNAVGRIGTGEPVVLVDCHVDTIPLRAADRWTHDPFGADVEDGIVYGLGACDMKGSLAAAVHGIAGLASATTRGTVYVVGSVAEEMMEGAALRGPVETFDPAIVVIGEPTGLRVYHGQRGRVKLEVDVRGHACHAAHPEAGVNAAERMAELVSAVGAVDCPQDPHFKRALITCIDIHSEPYPSISVIPDFCRARFDCRFGPDVKVDTLIRLVEQQAEMWSHLECPPALDCHIHMAEFTTYAGIRYTVPEIVPAWHLPIDHPAVVAAQAGVAHAGIAPRLGTYGFSTNGGLTAGTFGIPTIGFGVGREQDAHAIDESIVVDDLVAATDGFAGLVAELMRTSTGRSVAT